MSNKVVTERSPIKLLTASEAENRFGKKYFYRQRIYRLAKTGKLPELNLRGRACFLSSHIVGSFLKELELKLKQEFPELEDQDLRVFYDTVNEKRVVVDGLFGKSISVDTDKESEEDLINKMRHIVEWALSEYTEEVEISNNELLENEDALPQEYYESKTVLPEEILWIRLDTPKVKDIEVKSYILLSLPSIARFIGIRPDQFSEWISQTTYGEFLLSASYKQIQEPEISVSWKKGLIQGLTPFIPFELLPEIIVSFRQSGRKIKYLEKAEMLYQLSKTTLESLGLAISGNKDRAAQELAKVSQGLGISAADQVIAIFKQYETRDYQVKTTKEFQSKIKQSGESFGYTIGKLTLGVTGRYPSAWKMYGISHRLPKKITSSSRDVMRTLSPSDSVGMTFGEKHYIKDQKLSEAIRTGKQGKKFYERLKNVGLLDK